MKLLTINTSNAKQQFTFIGASGERISIYLYYLPTQQIWAFDLSYDAFELKGVQLVTAPNVLRPYRKILNFGLMCVSNDRLDPFYINDFTTGRVKLYFLDSDEVEVLEESIFQ